MQREKIIRKINDKKTNWDESSESKNNGQKYRKGYTFVEDSSWWTFDTAIYRGVPPFTVSLKISRERSRMRPSHGFVGSSSRSIGNRKKWSYQCRLIQLKPVLTRISVVISNSGATELPIRHPRPGPPQTSQRSFLSSRFVYRDVLLLSNQCIARDMCLLIFLSY